MCGVVQNAKSEYTSITSIIDITRCPMSLKALPIKVPEEMYNRLDRLANKTHRTKTFYVREALMNYLEDLEDTYLALERLKAPGETISMEEIIRDMKLTPEERKEIGLDD